MKKLGWWVGWTIASIANLFVLGGVIYTLIVYANVAVSESYPVTFHDLPPAFFVMSLVLIFYAVVLLQELKTERMAFGRFLIANLFYLVMTIGYILVFATGEGPIAFFAYFIDFFGIYKAYSVLGRVSAGGYYVALIFIFSYFFVQLLYWVIANIIQKNSEVL